MYGDITALPETRAVLSADRKRKAPKMASRDGRDADKPYRVRVGVTWYWGDPTVPATALAAGDTVVIYPVNGEPHLAVLQGKFEPGKTVDFVSLEGEPFAVAADAIATAHLAAVDEVQ